MSKGFVYIMTSSIDGLIKIGKSKDWNRRCQSELESNGYKNANGLKTYFVVEVDDQEEIEGTMHDIFRESRVSNFELFAVDKDRAKRVLSKMGKQVYPAVTNSVKSSNTSNKSSKPKNLSRKGCTFKTLNIPVGSTLTLNKFNVNISVKTVDDTNMVEYNGNIMTLTEAERLFNPKASWGFMVFEYNNERLVNIYKRLKKGN